MRVNKIHRTFLAIAILLAFPAVITLNNQTALAQSSAVDQFRQLDRQEPRLRQVLPNADVFTCENASLPHFKAYDEDTNGKRTLVGLAFFTNELDPKIYGYKAQFWMLVGMTTNGVLTGVSIDYHAEPFGYFSIDPPEYGEQFIGKSILDPLEVGNDIDAVSQATITIEAATRAIRQGSRQLARQFLSERK